MPLPFLRLVVCISALVTLLAACSKPAAPNFLLQGETMGTTYNITVVLDEGEEIDQQAAEQLGAEVDGLLSVFNQIASTYIENSELNQLNRLPVGAPVTISHTLHELLLLSLEVSWLSNGGFDITVAPLVNLWGFGPDKSNAGTVPSAEQIAAAKKQTGFKHIQLDMLDPEIEKRASIKMDLSAIAKGFAVDQIASLLERRGYQRFLVEVGGELRLKGLNPAGNQWRLAIEKPDPMGRSIAQIISVSDQAVATSGDYRNYFEKDGKRYSHTIDPRTGYPIAHNLASVTVIADTAGFADGMATALNVLGEKEALAVAEDLELAAFLIVKTSDGFKTLHSTAFEPFLVQ